MKRILLILTLITIGFWGFGQSVTTNAATSISYTTATLNASGSSLNSSYSYGVKFYYNTSSPADGFGSTSSYSNTVSGVTSASFNLNLTSLSDNQIYYFNSELWVNDGGGWVSAGLWGGELNFTTLTITSPTVSTGTATNVDYHSFDVNSNNVTDDGGDAITVQGLAYSAINNPPTTGDSTETYTPTGTGSYDVSLTSLSAGKTYYVRAYATNGQGTSYGLTITQATTAATFPTVTIPSTIDNITKTTAHNTGNDVTSENGASVTDKGICWNTTGSPTISDDAYSSGATGTGTYNGDISGLSAGTKYFVKAYASSSAGDGYSAEVNFITNTDDPTLLAAASNIHANDFDADWSSTTGAQGYRLDVATDIGFGAGTFVSGYEDIDVGNVAHKVVSGLTANTTYYYRIRAYHDGGDNGANFTSGNSGTNSVTTLAAAPTTQVSNMKWETVNAGKDMAFNWTPGNGSATIFVMRDGSSVQDPWGGKTYTADANFGDGDNIDGTGTYVVYNSTHAKGSTTYLTVTGLTPGSTYYFKAMDYNGSGSTTNYNTTAATGYNSGNSGSTALPINLISFDANQENSSVILKWQTASELNNDVFIIERSVDAINFEPIGKVKGSGTTNSVSSYNFTDKQSPTTVVYYRLKQVDYDGTSTTHTVISIDMSSNTEGNLLNKLLVLNTNLSLELNLEETGATKISLMDLNGKFLQGAVSTTPGAQTITFDMSGLSHGVYIVLIQQNDKSVSRKIAY